jgi:hypothetical protein
MKYNTSSSACIESVLTKKAFTIKASPKTFLMLSKTLYPNPIKSMIREIIANAIDATNDYNKSKGINEIPKIKVVLPTEVYPVLEIEDFGKGMSEIEVSNIYTKYGESTKEEDNNAIGCFGLGAKTPFAYTDLFEVDTITSGFEYDYNMYLNNGLPVFTKANTKVNKEKTHGTKIKIPIKNKDFNEIIKSYIKLIAFFSCEIEDNIKAFDKSTQKEYLKMKDFSKKLYSKKDLTKNFVCSYDDLRNDKYIYDYSLGGEFGLSSNIIVVSGGIAYPWNDKDCSTDFKNCLNEYIQITNKISNGKGLIVYAPIGSVTMTLSREELNYNPEIRKTIYSTIWDYIFDTCKKAFDKDEASYFLLFGKLNERFFNLTESSEIEFESFEKLKKFHYDKLEAVRNIFKEKTYTYSWLKVEEVNFAPSSWRANWRKTYQALNKPISNINLIESLYKGITVACINPDSNKKAKENLEKLFNTDVGDFFYINSRTVKTAIKNCNLIFLTKFEKLEQFKAKGYKTLVIGEAKVANTSDYAKNKLVFDCVDINDNKTNNLYKEYTLNEIKSKGIHYYAPTQNSHDYLPSYFHFINEWNALAESSGFKKLEPKSYFLVSESFINRHKGITKDLNLINIWKETYEILKDPNVLKQLQIYNTRRELHDIYCEELLSYAKMQKLNPNNILFKVKNYAVDKNEEVFFTSIFSVLRNIALYVEDTSQNYTLKYFDFMKNTACDNFEINEDYLYKISPSYYLLKHSYLDYNSLDKDFKKSIFESIIKDFKNNDGGNK